MPRSDRTPRAGAWALLRGPYLLLWLSVIILGLNWPVMKLALQHVAPFWMVALRYCFSVPVVAALILVLRHRLPRFERRDLRVILGVAFLQFVIQMGLVTFALQWVAAGTASILIYTTPVWLVLLDGVIFGQQISASRLWPTLLSATGCLLVLLGAGHIGVTAPLLLILAAALCWSCSMRLIASHVWSGGVLDALFWQFLIAGLVSLPIAFVAEGGLELGSFSAKGLALLAFVGPVATGIGFLSSAVFLGEPLSLMLVSGAATMLLAFVWGAVSGK